MKTNSCCFYRTWDVNIIATFGDARLLRHVNGRYELRGGSVVDHADTKQWISLFLHEAAVSFPSPVARRARPSEFARCVSNVAVRWIRSLRLPHGLRPCPSHGHGEPKEEPTNLLLTPQHNLRKAKA